MSIVTGRRLNKFFNAIKEVFSDKDIYGDTTMSLGRKANTTVGLASVVVGGGMTNAGVDKKNTASGVSSAVLGGYDNTASGLSSAVVGGYTNTASGSTSAVVGGYNNTASYYQSAVVGGYTNKASGISSAVLGGNNNTASGISSAVLGGNNNTTDGSYSAVLGGKNNTANNNSSIIIGGSFCKGQGHAVIMGHYNDTTKGTEATEATGTGTGTAFEIGNGTESAASNAIRVDYNGKLWCKAAYSSSGADYAELFEWLDGNPDSEKRVGYFVTMSGKKIKKANRGDWILGIVSANPCVLGNSDMEWQGQFMKDEFGAYIIEHHKETVTEVEPVLDGEGNPVIDEETGKPATQEVEKEVEYDFYKVNPDYNPDEQYIDRLSRPEWDAEGMIGVLSVWDDGTCEVDGFCTCGDGGVATKSKYGYRVIERVANNIVKVVINAESNSMVANIMNKNTMLEDRIAKLEQQIQQLLGA